MRVGVLGCGAISDIYLKNLTGSFEDVAAVACADVAEEKAREAAKRWSIIALSPEELLCSPEIDCILLLTPPLTHYALGTKVLTAGKHLYTEKPLAMTVQEGHMLEKLAEERGLRIGCAPDTMLGAGFQTIFSAIDRKMIGRPLAASAFMLCGGHERWHPNPAFYYQPGGGPIMDMGPYALTALVKIFGPAKEVHAMGMRSLAERVIATGPQAGQQFPVLVDTFLSAQIRFANDAIVTLIYSFDTAPTVLPHLEIYGETGTLLAPDPNCFDGKVYFGSKNSGEWLEIPLLDGYPTNNMRGIGLQDMACAIREKRPHQADAHSGLRVVAIMEAILRSAAEGKPQQIVTE